ncbi:lactococcin 972 family bacteriocin [Curtobacterium sp. PhB128]|nr:lactococcin 972 family bacteriocin [Curtobacterium sp. PhB128]TCL90872.1 lactococcin 972 family bacteriocin [Curtobacterium sp. PhB138]
MSYSRYPELQILASLCLARCGVDAALPFPQQKGPSMKRFGKLSAVIAAATLCGVLGAGVAQAAPDDATAIGGSASADDLGTDATTVVGGGTWSYGVIGHQVVSAYDNRRYTHSTSVKSSGVTKSSGRIAKGKIAGASRPKALWGNQAFWAIY